jgi:hypothetical protein
VGHQNHPGTVPQRIFNSGQSFADTGVVNNAPVFERNIEVNAHQDAVIIERKVADGDF